MKQENVFAAAGMLLPTSLVVVFYMYLGIFNRMLSDDYCSMYIGKRLGLLRSIWYWYQTWHGRFSANIADWLLSLFGSEAFPFFTFLFLSMWVVFATMAVKAVLDSKGYSPPNHFSMLLLGVFLVFATLLISPNISQSVFWWGGARSYLSPLILILLYFALYYHFTARSRNRFQVNLWSFVSFGLAFFIGGFSETFTPVFVVLLASMIGMMWLTPKVSQKTASIFFVSAGFSGALLSLIVMVLAPGNSIRRAFFPAPPDIFTTLRIAFTAYSSFLDDLFSSPTKLTALLGILLGSVWLGMRTQQESSMAGPRGVWIFVFLFAGFALAFGCFPPAVYATSEPPPARALITPAFFLAMSFLVSGFLFGEWLVSSIKARVSMPSIFLMVACGLILFSSWRAVQSLSSMRTEHIAFAQKWDVVDASIKSAKSLGLQEITIPAMKNWAGAQFPTDNPKYYPNVCYSKFYDINILAPPLQP